MYNNTRIRLPIVIAQVVANASYTVSKTKTRNVDADVETVFANWAKQATRTFKLANIDDVDREIIDNLVKGQLNIILQMIPFPTPSERVTEVRVDFKTPIVEIDFIVQLQSEVDFSVKN